MHHLKSQMLADIINQFDGPFDAHSIERRLLRLHTVETAEEILHCRDSNDVLRTFSAQLARYIDRTFRGQIQRRSRVRSQNLGGRDCDNMEWEKLVDPVVAPNASTNGSGAELEEDASEILEDERLREAIHAIALRNAIALMEEEP